MFRFWLSGHNLLVIQAHISENLADLSLSFFFEAGHSHYISGMVKEKMIDVYIDIYQ